MAAANRPAQPTRWGGGMKPAHDHERTHPFTLFTQIRQLVLGPGCYLRARRQVCGVRYPAAGVRLWLVPAGEWCSAILWRVTT